MKKSIFSIALMASLLASATDDSYLYWMVNVEENNWDYNYEVKVLGKTSSKEDTGTFLNLYYGDATPAGMSIGRDLLQDYKQDPGAGFYAGFASNAGYTSYVIELLSDNNDLLGRWTWADAAVETYIAQNGIKPPSLAPLTMSMALPAPEPSSGLLLLLGLAGLALRRRKQIAA